MCGAAVADPQTPLQQRGRGLSIFQHDSHCILEKLVVIILRRAAAARATAGDYFATGKELAKRRRKDVRMNTEVRNVKE